MAAPILPELFGVLKRDLRIDRRGRLQMRGAVGQHEGYRLAGLHLEIGNRGQILAASLDRRAQHGHILAGDGHQRMVDPPHPGDIETEAEADDELHPHLHRAADAADQPHDVGRLAARRHEIDQRDGAALRLETRFEDESVAEIAA
ncbi:hypothetical protein ABH985_004940 [Bradyrhizobium ottawaense]